MNVLMAVFVVCLIGIAIIHQNVCGQTLYVDKGEKDSDCTVSLTDKLAEVEYYLKTSVTQKLLQLENKLQDIIDKTNMQQNNGEEDSNSTKKCRDQWTQFRERCYFYSGRIHLSFWDALSYCRSLGASLTVPEDVDENEFLKQMGRDAGDYVIWFGISDIYKEGQWLAYPDMIPITPNLTDWGILVNHLVAMSIVGTFLVDMTIDGMTVRVISNVLSFVKRKYDRFHISVDEKIYQSIILYFSRVP